MRLLDNGYVQLEENEIPQLRNNRVGKSIEDVVEKQAAFILTKKQRGDVQEYTTKLELVDPENNIYRVVAKDPVSSYAKKSMAGSPQGALDSGNSTNSFNRFAAAIIQEGLMEEQGQRVDPIAAAISYGKNSALGYETHHINGIDTQMKILASLTPEGQDEYIKQLINRGYRLSDDPRNQVRAYGSTSNVPGYTGPSGEKMVPENHLGFSEHNAVHAEIRALAEQYGLPDERALTGDNTIVSRMAGLPNETQKIAMGMALTEIGRLAAMKKLAKPGSEKFSQKTNAERKQMIRAEHELAKAFLPLSPELQALSDAHTRQLLRK